MDEVTIGKSYIEYKNMAIGLKFVSALSLNGVEIKFIVQGEIAFMTFETSEQAEKAFNNIFSRWTQIMVNL